MAGIGAPTTRGSASTGMFAANVGQLSNNGVLGGTKNNQPSYSTSNVGLTPTQVGPSLTNLGSYGGPSGYTSISPVSSTGASSGSLGSSISSLLGSLEDYTKPRPSSGATSYNPGTFSVQAQENPQLAGLINEQGQYRANLAQGSDQDAQLAMQRQRDVLSGLTSEFGADAASRGIANSGAAQQDLMNRVVNPGQAQLGQLNASLTSDARNKQLAALGQQAGMVNQQAQLTQNQQQFGLQSWQAQQQAQQAQAQLAAMQQNQGLNNLSSIVGLIGSLGNLYSGF